MSPGTMMNGDKTGSSACRRQSAKMASREVNFTLNSAQGDEESASLANSTTMTQFRGRHTQPKRRSVFDDMYTHFSSQRVDTAIRINSSLAPPCCDEMRFGDLDFSTDDFHFEAYDPTTNAQLG